MTNIIKVRTRQIFFKSFITTKNIKHTLKNSIISRSTRIIFSYSFFILIRPFFSCKQIIIYSPIIVIKIFSFFCFFTLIFRHMRFNIFIITSRSYFRIFKFSYMSIRVNSSFKLNTIYRVNIKVRACLSNPIIRNNYCRTISIINKAYNFHSTNRLLTFSRNTITYNFIKLCVLKFFKKFFFCLKSSIFFSSLKPKCRSRKHYFYIRNIISFFILMIF